VSETRATVFGLDLRAGRQLPFLGEATAKPTGRPVEVSFPVDGADGERWPASAELVADERNPDGKVVFQIERSPQAGYRIWGPAYGASILSADGRLLWGVPGEASMDSWQRLLVAQVLPFAAVLQGLEVLHASAVAIGGGTIALAGPSGSGKTSVALELCRRGAGFIADDVLALERTGGELICHPGTPVAAVDHAEAERLRVSGVSAGEALSVNDRERVERVAVGAEPLPLRSLFFLERRLDGPAQPSFEPVADPRMLLAATFNFVLSDGLRLAGLLDACALAARGQVERVVVGPGVDAAELGAAVEQRSGGTA
jgi:HPr Serine kinase C-terminal domain